jgi:hypothetical protein
MVRVSILYFVSYLLFTSVSYMLIVRTYSIIYSIFSFFRVHAETT